MEPDSPVYRNGYAACRHGAGPGSIARAACSQGTSSCFKACDGAGHPRIFLRVILPLMVPALATTTIFTFIWTWNDFFGALIYLTDPDMFTVPVALRAFVDSQSATSWGSLFAMSIVSLLPVFLVFLFGQRFLIKGIATTGIK